MNTRDLRVIKTKRAIHDAFLSLLRTKPLAKISVTELARIAEINKGTFYLHYRDIYDLYHVLLCEELDQIAEEITFFDLFSIDIDAFMQRLFSLSLASQFFQNNPFFSPENAPYSQDALHYFCSRLSEKVLQENALENTAENRLKLTFFFAGLGTLLRYHDEKSQETIIAISKQVYHNLFTR